MQYHFCKLSQAVAWCREQRELQAHIKRGEQREIKLWQKMQQEAIDDGGSWDSQ